MPTIGVDYVAKHLVGWWSATPIGCRTNTNDSTWPSFESGQWS